MRMYRARWTVHRVLSLGMIPLSLTLVALSGTSPGSAPGTSLLPLVWSLNAVGWTLIACQTLSRTTVGGDGISVHNALTTRHVPWHRVQDVRQEPGTKKVQLSRTDSSANSYTHLPGVTLDDLAEIQRLRDQGEAGR